MSISLSKKLYYLFALMLFISANTRADDLSLEDELNQLETQNQAEPKKQIDPQNQLESQLESQLEDADLSSSGNKPGSVKTSSKKKSSRNENHESIEQEYAMNGLSFGTALFSDNYNVHAEVVVNGTNVEISKKSDDFLNIGVMGRYAILPYNKVGTDLNVSVATSSNHTSANFSAITTIRLEANLGYAIKLSASTPLYFLLGAGYEHTMSKDLAEIQTQGGTAGQTGVGFGFSKNLNFEFMYSYVKHPIRDTFLENYAALTMANGASSVSYVASKASVVSNLLIGRLTYNY